MPQATSGAARAPAAKSAPVIEGLMADARLRGTAVKLAAAGRSEGVTTDITKAPRAGTSICESKLRMQSSASTQYRFEVSAAPIRQRLDGICVNTIVFTIPMRFARRPAASCELAASNPVQKKNAAAADSDKPWRSNSHSTRSEFRTSPPAKASILKSTLRRQMIRRDGPSHVFGLFLSTGGSGRRRYSSHTAKPTTP